MKRISNFLLLVCAVVLLSGCATIPPGQIGVKFNANSGISTTIEKPQVVWYNPITERILTFPVTMQNATFVMNANEGDKQGNDAVVCSTIEGAQLPVDITVSYHLAPENLDLYMANFGHDEIRSVQNDYVRWITQGGASQVSGKRSIFEAISTDRAKFGPKVKDVIAPTMAAYGLTVDEVSIGEVHPPEQVVTKVQERISASSELEKAKTDLEKARIDARTTITQAEREAEENRLLASQSETTKKLRRIEIRRKAIAKFKAAGGRAPIVGDSRVPFTNIRVGS